MRILVTNDDGIESPGITALADALCALGEVTVVAPDSDRSRVAHSIPLKHPVRVVPLPDRSVRSFSCSGTPADCVIVGAMELCGGRPDLIVSGINRRKLSYQEKTALYQGFSYFLGGDTMRIFKPLILSAVFLGAIVALIATFGHAQPVAAAHGTPSAGWTVHIDAQKHFPNHPNEWAHHWCRAASAVPGMLECQIYGSDDANAAMVATEVIVPAAAWKKMDGKEQAYWHYH
ncbi:MAG: DUF1264 domain-containing protein, partial [Candidatus Eremiobacteraeota bacterium]|nr:DUF1264 domain-containing protein [Candidatus Eremiobacteraeota bacterium]